MNLSKNNIQKYNVSLIYLFFLIVIPLLLLLLPLDYFDNGRAICPSVVLFNKKCSACGLTRATQHFIHFDFKTAIQYNKLVIPVFIFNFILWVIEIINVSISIKKSENYLPFSFFYKIVTKQPLIKLLLYLFIFISIIFIILLSYELYLYIKKIS
jgi:hypothetical protein